MNLTFKCKINNKLNHNKRLVKIIKKSKKFKIHRKFKHKKLILFKIKIKNNKIFKKAINLKQFMIISRVSKK